MNSLVEYVDDGRPLFVFIPNPKCNHDSNETILETLSMSEKVLKMLLNILIMSMLLLGLHEVSRQFQSNNLTNLVCTSYQ